MTSRSWALLAFLLALGCVGSYRNRPSSIYCFPVILMHTYVWHVDWFFSALRISDKSFIWNKSFWCLITRWTHKVLKHVQGGAIQKISSEMDSTMLYTAYTAYNAQTVTCMPTFIVLKTGGPSTNQSRKWKSGKLRIFFTTAGRVFLHLL